MSLTVCKRVRVSARVRVRVRDPGVGMVRGEGGNTYKGERRHLGIGKGGGSGVR